MKVVSRILVAVDFSEYSLPTLQYAAGLARTLDAELILANVINQRDLDAVRKVEAVSPGLTVADYLAGTQEERDGMMSGLLEESGCEGLTVRRLIRSGVPHRVLTELVSEENIDMVIMGTKGRSNLADVIMGSTAEKMFRRCPVPLLSLRPENFRKPS